MLRPLIAAAAASALASCGPQALQLQTTACAPTTVQPAAGSPITPVARLAGCPDLIIVGGGPGITLYVSRASLNISDREIDALPLRQGGL